MSSMGKRSTSKLKVNGERIEASAPKGRSFLGFIREDLTITGAKKGCAVGEIVALV
jgi:aerobic-type carbon monoxide dehydrogenase small subunit (CoxS/CutS family)